ncbi:agmatinase [Pelagibacterium nitratireducens]|uniref:Agmatinase n=1 Tax=Pelagibacterium nitratireducens TaxID=1046114 RepID=A0ABZ2I4E5_9HYPH
MTSPITFLNLPDRLPDGHVLRAVIFGAGHGTAYHGQDSRRHALAPDAIRAASQADAELIENWDFDLAGPLFGNGPVSCIDVGNIETSPHDAMANRTRIEAKTREILGQTAVPILIGGDDSVLIPFLAAFAERGPVWVLQIDAHIDWRDEVGGEGYGFSSPMRRASEMAHVAGIVQVGIRSVGSARQSEVKAAQAYGSHIATAREVHAHGVEAALSHIPEGAQVVVTLDCDGLDPAVMPGVAAPTPGGLSYTQTIDLVAGASRRGKIVGFDLVELTPTIDPSGLSALTASRILVNAIGRVVRQT